MEARNSHRPEANGLQTQKERDALPLDSFHLRDVFYDYSNLRGDRG